jgi:hypothetical protein
MDLPDETNPWAELNWTEPVVRAEGATSPLDSSW